MADSYALGMLFPGWLGHEEINKVIAATVGDTLALPSPAAQHRDTIDEGRGGASEPTGSGLADALARWSAEHLPAGILLRPDIFSKGMDATPSFVWVLSLLGRPNNDLTLPLDQINAALLAGTALADQLGVEPPALHCLLCNDRK